jgi:hypothetical protein
MSIGERLQSIPRWGVYLMLILVTSVPLFLPIRVPNKPVESTIDLYAALMELPTDKPVLIASDWTKSTRGESQGQFNSIMRILMRRGINVVFYSTGDPQAPRVYQDSMRVLNEERAVAGEPPYERWNNWVSVGFFAGSEAATNGIANDLRGAFRGRKDFAPGRGLIDVFESPVMRGITKVQDFPVLLVITGSKTSNITVERVSGKTPLAFAVTGVMTPETQVFYQSKQIVGFAGGLKGLYDLETLMEVGINTDNPNTVKSEKYGSIPGFPGQKNDGQGTRYYPTLHFAMALMILMVVLGNVGLLLTKSKGRR